MNITNVIALLSGVALFLFGMSLMGDGLKKVAGGRLETILYQLSNTPLKGVLLGTGITAVIQSSSATSVMVVGFVNAGMMKFRQAIGIILGAILGTSITGWILCLSDIGSGGGWIALLSTSTITGLAAVAGILLQKLGGKSQKRFVGDILLGFAVLMFGMSAMSGAVSPLRESQQFISILTGFSNPLLGILVGAAFTCVLQSASAAVGILQALASTGAITFEVAFPIIMGIAIGASLPVMLSAVGASKNGRRTAFAYLLADVMGAVACSILFYGVNLIHPLRILSRVMSMVSIAAANTIFRLVTVIILFPMIPLIEKIIKRLIRDKEGQGKRASDLDGLDERFLSHPALLIQQCAAAENDMAEGAKEALLGALQLFDNYDEKLFQRVDELEGESDHYEDRLGTYLTKSTVQELTPAQGREVSRLLHALSDLERLSDYALMLAKNFKEINDGKIDFSEDAKHELGVLRSAVTEVVELSIGTFVERDQAKAARVEPLVVCIKELCHQMKARHIDRLQNNMCTFKHGFVFNDLLTSCERVAGHCSNVALAVVEMDLESLATHEYMDEVKGDMKGKFRSTLKEYQSKYTL
ncbi:MAG: Na/Pi cotransporter family protein [Oscillospiraceae bacterium]|nr:Na/Pi cotransporter family protein [Oscillospiraceae bacterium]